MKLTWCALTNFIYSFLILFAVGSGANAASPEVSCECEELSCGPCEVEMGTSFYSAKCGPANSRVKSCKKPTCEAVENQKQCLALFEKPTKPSDESAAEAMTRNPNAEESRTVSREPSSVTVVQAGTVAELTGDVRIVRARGGAEKPKVATVVNQGDLLETKSNGKIRVSLKDGSQMILPPNSRVRVELANVDPAKDQRQITLSLLSGKVRNRVQKKYDGENFYQVKTKTAVAGVRGTDFVASFEPGQSEWITEIRTIEGKVRLSPPEPKLSEGTGSAVGKSVDITAGNYAAYIVKAPEAGDDEGAIERLALNGFLTPSFGMKEEDLRLLNESTDLKMRADGGKDTSSNERKPATSSEVSPVCSAPSGQYNQCSWTCEGKNPKGAKTCRTDLPDVKCVRRLCRASGEWAEPARVPASQSDLCEPNKAIVRDCGNYW